MEFEGREKLANGYMEYFEKYNIKFTENIKNAHKNINNKISSDGEEIYNELFNMLLTKNFDISKGKEITKNKEFNKGCFFEAMTLLFIDFAKHIHSNSTDNKPLTYLAFAFDRYNTLFGNNEIQNNIQSSINVFSASNSTGFFIHENFIDTFKKIEKIEEKLEFLNLYNGVPVRTFGEIIQTEDNSIIVKVDLMQILAMKEEDCAYIVQNKYLQKNIKANILWVNITNCTVCLNNFESQPYMHALKRAYPRVHPNEFTKIALTHSDGRVANGKLFDISEGGIGVVSMEDVGFKNGDLLSSHITLRMPKTNEPVELDLQFKLVVLIVYKNAYRYCLEILPNQEDAKKIQEFAILRVEETLVELKDQLKLYTGA